MKFTLAIVAFKPDWSELLNRVQRLNHCGLGVLIIDNTPSEDDIEFQAHQSNQSHSSHHSHKDSLLQLAGIHYHEMGGNLGICKAYNYAVECSLQLGAEWMFTFDQDTQISSSQIEQFVNHAQSLLESKSFEKPVGMIVPSLQLAENLFIGPNHPSETYEIISQAMSSGSFLNLSIFTSSGGFDETYWLDGFDHDYCLQLKANGYGVVRIHSVILKHSLGNVRKVQPFFLRSPRYLSQHEGWRRRLIARNRRVLWKKFPQFQAIISEEQSRERQELRESILFEHQGIMKAIQYALGILDFYRGKRGAPDGIK